MGQIAEEAQQRDASNLRRALGVIEQYRSLDPEMQAQTMVTYLLAAVNEGISMRELQDRTGLASSSLSRNIAALGKWHRKNRPGHDLLVAREDPMERRRKQVYLTTKGKHFMSRLLDGLQR